MNKAIKEVLMGALRPRLSVDVTPKQQKFLERLPFGWKQHIFSALIDMLIDMTDRCGTKALSAIAAKAIKLEDYFKEE